MPFPTSRFVLAIALSAVPVIGLSGCGTSETADGSASSATAGTTSTSAPQRDVRTPSAEELQKKFAAITDPSVPADQKARLVAGGKQDPAAFDKLAQKLSSSPDASMTLSDPVTATSNSTVSVPFTASFNGQQTRGDATFVLDNGQWKLSHSNACAVLSLLAIPSPACPEA